MNKLKGTRTPLPLLRRPFSAPRLSFDISWATCSTVRWTGNIWIPVLLGKFLFLTQSCVRRQCYHEATLTTIKVSMNRARGASETLKRGTIHSEIERFRMTPHIFKLLIKSDRPVWLLQVSGDEVKDTSTAAWAEWYVTSTNPVRVIAHDSPKAS